MTRGAEASGAPASLRRAYWVFVAAAVVMLTAGLVGLAGLGRVPEDIGAQAFEFVRRNTLITALSNLVGAVALAVLAAQLPSGALWPRRLIALIGGCVSLVNVAALAIGIAGLALLLIPMIVLLGVFFAFHPEANEYVAQRRLRGD